MNIHDIKDRMTAKSMFLSEDAINGKPTVIGYEKRFKWRWFATQLNTFVFAVDFGDETITVQSVEDVLTEAFVYAKKNYSGWPRGLQSALGAIAILTSSSVDDDAARYCTELKSGKKWAGFSVPVIHDIGTSQTYSFDRNPMWGRIYYPHFRDMINELVSRPDGP